MKHFIINPEKEKVEKREILQTEKEKQKKLYKQAIKQEQKNLENLKRSVPLFHVPGKVIISINLESKNSHTFSNGEKIYIGRQFNNLNRRETEPVNAYVVSGENVKQGSQILIHPNAIQDTYKIFGFMEDESDVKYYSIPEDQCYLWYDEDEGWQPFKGFATGLRLFKEYTGTIEGIEPELLKDVLYITSGEYKGKVVRTLKACDYEIIFMGLNGIEERVIRCRHFEDEINEREEIICIDDELTRLVQEKELMVGINKNDAKYIIFTI